MVTVIGDNVQVEVEGNVLILRVDLSQNFGLSSSGKSVIIASSGGNASVPGYSDVKVGLNVFRPNKQTNGRY